MSLDTASADEPLHADLPETPLDAPAKVRPKVPFEIPSTLEACARVSEDEKMERYQAQALAGLIVQKRAKQVYDRLSLSAHDFRDIEDIAAILARREPPPPPFGAKP